MIDQASVFADRFRNNRQALQAAVLGQNSGVDPYTALRALQLLKESDSMQMAQQGQQPTEEPSLLQEAMQQPQGLAGMPTGQPVPGQQMPQAPQQSGGLEAMPVSDQMFSGAGGGIVAFANKGSVPAGDIVGYAGPEGSVVSDSPDDEKSSPAGRYFRNFMQSGLKQGADYQERERLRNAIVEKFGIKSGVGGMFAQQSDTQRAQAQQIMSQLDRMPIEEMRQVLTSGAPTPVPPINDSNAERDRNMQEVANQGQNMRPTMANDPRLMGATPPTETAAGPADIPDGSSVVPAVDPAFAPNTFLNNGTDMAPVDATTGGLGALAAPTYTPASRDRLNTALDAQAAFKPTESTITPPRGLQAKIEDLKGDQGSLKALEGLFGTDEASTKAQAMLNKRLKDLEDPDRNKFDKALGFFKAAGALQKTIDKNGRRVTPMGAAAEAMGEVASVYSGIRKEDRKAKQLIEDSQMALDKAGQARKDGLTSKAFDLENQADKDRTAAETLQANINARKDQAKATLLAATTTAEGAAYSGDRSSAAQVYASDLARLSAKERNATNEKMNMLTAERLVTDKNLAAYNAASDTLRKAEVDVDKAMKDNTELQRVITNITRYESKAAKGEIDKKELAALENSRAKRAQLEKKYADQLKAAKERFNVISGRVISASDASAGGNDQEAAARQWLKNNPNDPRAAAIRKKLGM